MDDLSIGTVVTIVVGVALALVVLLAIARTVRIVSQANAGIVERLGRYHRTLDRACTSCSRSSITCDRSSTCASRSSPSRRSR